MLEGHQEIKSFKCKQFLRGSCGYFSTFVVWLLAPNIHFPPILELPQRPLMYLLEA
jgi:hypothetical protein